MRTSFSKVKVLDRNQKNTRNYGCYQELETMRGFYLAAYLFKTYTCKHAYIPLKELIGVVILQCFNCQYQVV